MPSQSKSGAVKRTRAPEGPHGGGGKKQPTSASIGGGGSQLGRLGRAMAEDPILTSVTSRSSADHPLKLLVQVRTNYRSMPGARRQVVDNQRNAESMRTHGLQQLAHEFRTFKARPQTSKPTPPPAQFSIEKKGGATKKGTNTGGSTNGGNSAGGGATVERYQWMVVPEYLSEDYWERHRYSISDIRKTLDAFPARILWQLVISYNRSATNASSRVCSDSDLKLTFGGKSTAIQKLLTVLKELHPDWVDRPSVTWNMSKLDDPNGDGQVYDVADRHTPGLPVHRISRSSFEHLLDNLVFWPSANIMQRHNSNHSNSSAASIDQQQADQYFILHKTGTGGGGGGGGGTAGKTGISVTTKIAKSIFAWRGIHTIPLELNKANDLLLVARIVPWTTYVEAYGMPESLRTCPNFVLAQDGYWAILDECFYFFSPIDPLLSALKPTLPHSTLFKPPSDPTTRPPPAKRSKKINP